jgi:hypothetical protein
MYRLAYRRFRDGHESLVVNHSVSVGANKNNSLSSIRWYELRNGSGGTMASTTLWGISRERLTPLAEFTAGWAASPWTMPAT